MQFIDLKAQYQVIKKSIDDKIFTVLDHGQYVMGPEVYELERKLAEYAGTKHCISCSSGTDALVMSLMAYGIGKGDVVITTPFTFIATAEAINFVGATPLFVDINRETYNISSSLLEKTLSDISDQNECIHSNICKDISKVKAIISVDLFGLAADAERINQIAKEYNLIVIEDAAQGFGGTINGRRACSFGDIGCTSFFPAKPLGCYGDGGAIFTDNDEIANKLKSIRVHGQGEDKYENVRLGMTGRLDTIQAAILLSKLDIFEDEIVLRNNVADQYSTELSKIEGLTIPTVPIGYKSSWAQYTVLAKDSAHRNIIIEHLKNNGIPVAIYYPIPLHLQKAFSFLKYEKGAFEVSESISERAFSLPMHPYLKLNEIEMICEFIKEV